MNDFTFLLIGAIAGFVVGIVVDVRLCNSDTAIKLSNVMNATMLDCVTDNVITKEQVHDIEDVFFKHIKINFKHIKTSHDDKWGRRMKLKDYMKYLKFLHDRYGDDTDA